MLRWDPPPLPLGRQVGQSQPKPPSRHGDQGGGWGGWANELPCHPPQCKAIFFPPWRAYGSGARGTSFWVKAVIGDRGVRANVGIRGGFDLVGIVAKCALAHVEVEGKSIVYRGSNSSFGDPNRVNRVWHSQTLPLARQRRA